MTPSSSSFSRFDNTTHCVILQFILASYYYSGDTIACKSPKDDFSFLAIVLVYQEQAKSDMKSLERWGLLVLVVFFLSIVAPTLLVHDQVTSVVDKENIITSRQAYPGFSSSLRPKTSYTMKNGTLAADPSTWDCLRPRSFPQDPGDFAALPKPWIHIGMPKTGTTSLEEFWKCGLDDLPSNDHVSHSTCKVSSEQLRLQAFDGKGTPVNPLARCSSRRIEPCRLCGVCMNKAKNLSMPLLSSCGGYQAWAQLDTEEGCFFPQLQALDLIHEEAPNATFVFMFRGIQKWVNSVRNYKKGFMLHRFTRCKAPFWKGRNYLEEWFCGAVNHARSFVEAHPSHAYIEIDLDDPSTSQLVSRAFGIPDACWGRHNVNERIHAS